MLGTQHLSCLSDRLKLCESGVRPVAVAHSAMTHKFLAARISEPIRKSQGAFEFLHHPQFASLDGVVVLSQQIRLLLDQLGVRRPKAFALWAMHFPKF